MTSTDAATTTADAVGDTIVQPRPADMPLPTSPDAPVHFPLEPEPATDAVPAKPKRVRAKKITVTDTPPPPEAIS